MKKFSLELPKYRLQLHMKLIKRRKPLLREPLVPTTTLINKKYRTGTLVGKIARHLSEHKSIKKVFAANMAAFVLAGSLFPSVQAETLKTNLEPEEAIIQTQNTLKTEKSIQYPVENIKINQGYSFFHPAIDLGGSIGDSIKPIKAGIVVEAMNTKIGYGNTILVEHSNGLTSRYAHLSKIDVQKGDSVTTNTEIGKLGISGRTTGPHLHLEIRQNGIPLNPLSVISK